MNKEPIISLRNISVTYKTKKSWFSYEHIEALKDVSFDVYPGETLGVVGHNGAGKSTLLKVLAGIYAPDQGFVLNKSKRTSLLTLSAGFDPNLTGRDNAMIVGLMMGYSRVEVSNLLESIRDYSELNSYFDKEIKTYSTGMRARLGFSIACNLEADVILLDEIMGVGDKQFKSKAQDTIHDLMNSNRTVVLVSHSESIVKNNCNRVIEINKGHLV